MLASKNVNRSLWHQVLLGLGLLALAVALGRLPLAACAALTFGGVFLLASLVRPWVALLALPFAVPFGSLVEVQVGILKIGATEAAILWALATWLAWFCAQRRQSLRWPQISLAFWGLVLAALLSTTQSLSLQYSVKELLKWGQLFVALWVTLNLLSAPHNPPWLPQAMVASILLAGSLAALHGVVQFLGRIGPPGFLLFDRFMRAHGTFEQPNPYGGYLGLVFPLAYALALAGRRTSPGSQSCSGWVPLVGLGSAGLTALALLMSWSRGAWLGAAAAFATVSALRSRRAAFAFGVGLSLLAVLILLGMAGFIPSTITERFAGLTSYLQIGDVTHVEPTPANWAVVERLAHWQAAWGMFSDHPWLGVGWGNYVPAYPAYALPRWADPLGHAHNIYLNVLAEGGLMGLAAYLIFWAAAFVAVWRAVRQSHGFHQAVALGVLGVFVHLSVHNFFDNLYVHGMPVHVGLLLGLALWAGQTQTQRPREGN
ncbi:MAG: O-antigen ligase family protein [Anaerolineae bacterium]